MIGIVSITLHWLPGKYDLLYKHVGEKVRTIALAIIPELFQYRANERNNNIRWAPPSGIRYFKYSYSLKAFISH
jgi:hypothetical protein